MPELPDLRRGIRLQLKRSAVWWRARRGDLISQLMLHEHLADPYPLYERIRAHGPLYESRMGVHAVTSHELCAKVLRDPAFMRRHEDDASRTAADDEIEENDENDDRSFLEMEVSDHMRWRRLVAPAFRPKMISRYRELAEKVAHRLLDEAATRESFDLVEDYAAPLPIVVISEMLGLTDVDVPRFAHYGFVTGRAIDGIRSVRQAREFQVAMRELTALFTDLVRDRRREPGEDLVSELVRSGDISVREVVGTCQLLLTAGFETTTNLVGNAVLRLLSHPGQWAALVGNPGLAPQAVEEALRYDPPVQYSVRQVRSSFDTGTRVLEPGAVMMLMLAAANRDPAVFDDPQRFDITRPVPSSHLAFLSGAHYCVGAPLARMEGDVALRVLVDRMPRLRALGTPEVRPTAALRGMLRMPVRA